MKRTITFSKTENNSRFKTAIFKGLLTLLLVFGMNAVFATTYYSKATGNANATATWGLNTNGTGTAPGNFTTSGDIFILSSTSSLTTNNDWVIGSGVTLQIDGDLAINGNNNDVTINGTVIFTDTASTQVSMAGAGGGNTFVVASGATLRTYNVNGIQGTNSSLPVNASKKTVILDDAANYIFSGAANQTANFGNVMMNNLTISNTGGSVTLNAAIDVNGNLLINNGGGSLTAGALTHAIAGNWTNNGTFVQDTSTINLNGTSQTIGVTSTTTFNNLSLSGGTKTFGIATAINGNLTIASGAVANLGSITTHTAGTLTLGTLGTAAANFGSNSTLATPIVYKNNTYFTAGTTGYITVGTSSCTAPTITFSAIPNICEGALSYAIPYTAVTGAPNLYSISGVGITSVTDGVLSAPSASITVNLSSAAAPGTISPSAFTVSSSVTGCVSANLSGSVSVIPSLGVPNFTIGATSVCQDAANETYTASATNSTGITYSVLPAGAGTIGSSTGIMNWNAAFTGTATITASAAGCGGPLTVDRIVTVTPTVGPPSFTAGATALCQDAADETYTATATDTTGITYSVSPVGAGTINSSTGVMDWNPGYFGTATITASAAGCNGPKTVNRNVTVTQQSTWYLDADGDGYITATPTTASACSQPASTAPAVYRLAGGVIGFGVSFDCNDTVAAINPGATEICFNNIDDDCNGSKFNGCTGPIAVTLHPIFTPNFPLGAISTTIFANAPSSASVQGYGVTYVFEITNTNTTNVVELSRSTPTFNLTMTNIYSYGTVFSIRVKAIVNGEDQGYVGAAQTVLTPTIPTPSLIASQCNITLPTIGTFINSAYIYKANTYEFTISSPSFTSPSQVVFERNTYDFRLSMMPTYVPTYNTVYNISVRARVNNNGVETWSAPSGICSVTTPGPPATRVIPAQCGATLPSINTAIEAVGVLYATQYQFMVATETGFDTNAYGTPVELAASSSSNFRITSLATPLYGRRYQVWVRAGVPGSSGTIWGSYEEIPCIVSSPPAPAVDIAVSIDECSDGFTPATTSTLISSNTLPGVYRYIFIIDGYQADGLSADYHQEVQRTVPNVSLNMFTGLESGGHYSIRVALIMVGSPIIIDEGHDCSLINIVSKTVVKEPFMATAYPNPFASNFMIDVKTSSQSVVSLKVYDMLGRMIEQRNVTMSDIWSTTLGDQYPSGVYNVVISQENSVQTIRVVKR